MSKCNKNHAKIYKINSIEFSSIKGKQKNEKEGKKFGFPRCLFFLQLYKRNVRDFK